MLGVAKLAWVPGEVLEVLQWARALLAGRDVAAREVAIATAATDAYTKAY